MNEGTPIKQDFKPCAGCGESIFWVKTAANNKWIPLNIKPERRILIGEKTGLAHSVTVYMPHHVTCEKVEDFR